jgi:hypothetical protein
VTAGANIGSLVWLRLVCGGESSEAPWLPLLLESGSIYGSRAAELLLYESTLLALTAFKLASSPEYGSVSVAPNKIW